MPRLVSVPNLVSLSRVLLCVPLTVCLLLDDRQGWAAASLILFGATDWVDGWLARRWVQATRLGAALDAGADRIGITVIVIVLAVRHTLPAWIPIAVASADLALAVAGLAKRARIPASQVTFLGKIRTALMTTGLPLLVATAGTPHRWAHDIAMVLLILGCLGHVAAAILYIRQLVSRPRERGGRRAA